MIDQVSRLKRLTSLDKIAEGAATESKVTSRSGASVHILGQSSILYRCETDRVTRETHLCLLVRVLILSTPSHALVLELKSDLDIQ